jgi:hypothetical protein
MQVRWHSCIACAALVKATVTRMAAINVLIMNRSLSDKFPNTISAFERAFSLSKNH